MTERNRHAFATRAVHSGGGPDPATGAVSVPIYATSTYAQQSPGVHKGYAYGRSRNPTRDAVEMRGFGGMITIELATDLAGCRRALERARLFTLAESLGGTESLLEHPAIMTHSSVPAEQRRALGIGDSLVRLSIGVEDVEDLIADLGQALTGIAP